MPCYYKGIIVNSKKVCVSGRFNVIFIVPDNFDKYYVSVNGEDYVAVAKLEGNRMYENFEKYISEKDQRSKSRLDNYAIKIYDRYNEISGEEIIFEKVYDDDGNAYAQELVSGVIFPISSDFSSYNFNYFKSSAPYNKVYINKEHNRVYVLEKDQLAFSPIYGNLGISFESNSYNNIKKMKEKNDSQSFHLGTGVDITLHVAIPSSYVISCDPEIKESNNQVINYTIFNEKIATELEVRDYLQIYTGPFKRRRKNAYINSLTEMSIANYLGDDIQFFSSRNKRVIIEEAQFTKEAQELEFLLSRLKNVSEEDYIKINNEYNELLNQVDNVFVVSSITKSLISLQNKATLAYMCHGGTSKQVIEFLEKQAGLYIKSCNDTPSDKTKMSISELDNISEKILSNKTSFNFKEQNDILRHIALLYFLELYENRNTVTSEELGESYINNNIKRIITIINALLIEGFISECNHDIYSIDNIGDLLELIKDITLTLPSKDELVKKISL